MSAAPDPAELAPSRDPAAYGKRPLFSRGFVGWIVLCVICIGLGVAIGRFAPLPRTLKSEPPTAPAENRPAEPTALPEAMAAPAATAGAAAQTSGPTPPGLADRVARLEAQSGRANDAAAEALAAAALSAAAEGSGPFDQDLAAYGRLDPGDPDLHALAPLAALGAPSRAMLAAAFPDLASAAAAAARQPPKDAGFLDRLMGRFAEVVVIRRVGPAATGVDGLLYRAQTEVGAGDLEGALATLDRLPDDAGRTLAGWEASARRRIEIDRGVAEVRARALSALTAAGAAPP